MNKLTVITVTWNAKQTLERTLRSVQEQTYPLMEHLIVDGASNDGTLALIDRYAEIWTAENTPERELRWISEPDRGLYDAMNKAIAMANGQWLCFLNAGDTFCTAETVEQMMHSFNTNTPPDILYGETAIVDNNGVFLHMRRLQAPEQLTWKSFKQGMVVCHQAFIVQRALAEPYDLNYRFSSDFDWCIRMMRKSSTIHNTHLTLIRYLNEGMTTANHKASLKERYRIMVRYYGHVTTFLYHLWFVIRTALR